MTGRSNWENKNAPQLSATERLKAALSRPVNEAIKVKDDTKDASEVKAVATPRLLGAGAATKAMQQVRGRKGQIDDQTE